MGNSQTDNKNENNGKNSIEKNENDNEINEYKNAEDNNHGKKYIWIDQKIKTKENLFFYNIIFSEKRINCEKCDNIDEAYNYLIEEQNEFKEIFIIISGKLLISFYYKIKNNIDKIKFSPTIIVFTSNTEFVINQLKMNNIYYNNYLLDNKLIFNDPYEILNFINNKKIEENDLTFDIIDNIDQLIIPNYYSYLLEDVNFPEILYFNSYLKKILRIPTEEEINELEKTDNDKLKQLNGNELAQKFLN